MKTKKTRVVTAVMPNHIKIQDRLPLWMGSMIWVIGTVASMSDAVSGIVKTVVQLV
jgi:hypothetical protein